MLQRRHILQLAAAAPLGALARRPALAAGKSFATHAVKITVAGPPGGGSDLLARIIAAELGPLLGQPAIVENRPGAGGIIGTKAVADSPADGHSLLLGHVATNAIVPALYTPKPYDAVGDFEPVSPVGTAPDVLVVSAKSPVKTLADLLAVGRKEDSLTYGSPGIGLPQHFFGYMLAKETGVTMRHVPYRGTAPAIMDLLGGQISMLFATSGALAPFIRDGQVRPIASATDERSRFFPQVPTLRDLGYPSIAQRTWFGVFAPARTPRPVVDELNGFITAILARPAVRSKLEAAYIDPAAAQSADAYKAYVRMEADKWAGIVRTTGITPQ